MAKKVQLIVVTDLDASLLDESYSYEGATEALELLQVRDIPLVWNSSKTLDEMIEMSKHWQWKRKPILVGENGHGDDFGIGSSESFTVMEIAQMFGGNIKILPERPGNRMVADIITEKTEKLGWKASWSIKDYIKNQIL